MKNVPLACFEGVSSPLVTLWFKYELSHVLNIKVAFYLYHWDSNGATLIHAQGTYIIYP